MSLEDASHCAIDGCHFKYVSHCDTVAVWDMGPGWFSFGCPWNPADGHSGIYLAGQENIIKNSSVVVSSSSGIVIAGKNSTVDNCIVKECNYAGTGQGGISVWRRNGLDPDDGSGVRITKTTLKYNTYNNIKVGAAVSGPTARERLRISYCDFGASCWMSQENGSLGAQNCQFAEVDHNWFHGVAGPESGDIVMESDVGVAHWIVHHNVFWQGKFSTGECPMQGTWYGGQILRGYSWTPWWYDTIAMIFNNTVVDSGMRLHRDWDMCQGQVPPYTPWPGMNKNNVWCMSDTAPWKFTDAAAHDYSLRAGSPLIDKGVIVPGYVETFNGAAPDKGAYEFGEARWVAGADWKEQPWVYPPPAILSVSFRSSGAPRIGLTFGVYLHCGGLIVRGSTETAFVARLFTMRGEQVAQSAAIKTGVARIPTAGISSGVYVLRVSGENGGVAHWEVGIR